MTDGILEIGSMPGTGVPARDNGIDTDQITSTRLTKVVTSGGLSEFVFLGQRYDENDEPKDHPLSKLQSQDASIMVVNTNFGCGSPREHTPQALTYWGIDTIVGGSFTEIFTGNRFVFGILTIATDHKTVTELQDQVDEHSDGDIDVDAKNRTITYGDTTMGVTVDDAQRKALTEGVWDITALMKSNAGAIAKKAVALLYIDD